MALDHFPVEGRIVNAKKSLSGKRKQLQSAKKERRLLVLLSFS
jgi:hypothetical protein